MPTNFANFIKDNPNWQETYEVYQRDSDKHKRMICRSSEKIEEKILKHEFHAVINVETGDVYPDCRRRKIFAKHLTLIAIRPIHIIIKTIWHLSIIGALALEISALAKGEITKEQLRTHTFQSLADIFRTPLYGTAITIVHIYGVIAACYDPNTLYETREWAGKLERLLLRVETQPWRQFWCLSECLSPLFNLALRLERAKERQYTPQDAIGYSTQQVIKLYQTKRVLYNYLTLHPQDQAYISSAKVN